MKTALLCDFDGTIVTIDACEYLLDTFVQEDWRILGTHLERGTMTLEECIRQQLFMLKASKQSMFEALEPVVNFRPGFRELVEYCDTQKMPFVVVSGGLDFLIQHFLKMLNVPRHVQVHAATSRITEQGLELTFPRLVDSTSLDFKDDLVRRYQTRGFRVCYVGDGLSDFNAVRRADFTFVIKGSKLATLCKQERLPHLEVTTFHEVIEALKPNEITD